MADNFLLFLIFPGVIFTILMSFMASWWFRKLMARMENRIGPPFMQPMYDFAKLLAKERLYPEGSEKIILRYMPVIQVSVALLMALFIPFYGQEGLISFEGDIYAFIFLLAVHGVSTYFVGWASRNPYAISGAGRAVMTEISLEIPLSLSLAGISVMTGSMRISEITTLVFQSMIPDQAQSVSMANVAWLNIIPWLLFLIITIYCSVGALEYNPYSAAHAETEIVAGWSTELTGADLAMTKLADYINLFNLAGIISAVFLGGPLIISGNEWVVGLVATAIMVVKILFVVFIFASIATLSSRMRIDQITRSLWAYFLPLSMTGIFIVIGIQYNGGGI